jgi:orotate phosphoribosyltransferase
LSFVEGLDIDLDCFYGTADGATKLAVLCQYKWAKSRKDFAEGKYVLSMGRKVPKEHGEIKDKYFIGAPRGNILVLEDVTTTGSSLINAVKVLQKLNFKVTGALSLTDRNELTDKGLHVSQILAALGVRYYSMSNAIDVLPKAVKKKKPARPVTDSIEEEFKKYGVDKIEL